MYTYRILGCACHSTSTPTLPSSVPVSTLASHMLELGHLDDCIRVFGEARYTFIIRSTEITVVWTEIFAWSGAGVSTLQLENRITRYVLSTNTNTLCNTAINNNTRRNLVDDANLGFFPKLIVRNIVGFLSKYFHKFLFVLF